MTKAEMNRRLDEMSPVAIRDIHTMIDHGYGAHGISLEYPATIKQINAVFEQRDRGLRPLSA